MAASNFRGSPLQRTGIINGTCFQEDSSQPGSDRPSPVQQNKVRVTNLAPRYVLCCLQTEYPSLDPCLAHSIKLTSFRLGNRITISGTKHSCVDVIKAGEQKWLQGYYCKTSPAETEDFESDMVDEAGIQ